LGTSGAADALGWTWWEVSHPGEEKL